MPVLTGHGAAADPTTTTVVPAGTIAGPGHNVLTTPPLAPRQYDANIFNSGSSINSLLSLGSGLSAIFHQVEASLVPHAQATTNSGPSPVSVAALPQSPTTGNHHASDGYSPSLIMALEHELQHSEGDCTQPRNSDGTMEPAVSRSAPELNAPPMCHKRQHHRLECDGASAKDDSDAAKKTRSQPSSSATVRDCCEYHDNRNYSTVFNNYHK